MKIAGKEINLKYFLWYYCFNGLVIIDMFLITIALVFQIPKDIALDIQYFDLFVCLILLGGSKVLLKRTYEPKYALVPNVFIEKYMNYYS